MFLELLDRIHGHMVRIGCPAIDILQPGLPCSRVEAKAAELGLEFPDELAGLYAWRNGIPYIPGSVIGKIDFFPGYYFLCLEDASADYQAFKNDPRWNPQWFPVFASGGGDFYAVDCQTGKIIGFLLGEPEIWIRHSSIISMMKTHLHCLDRGIFFMSNDGYFEAEDEKWFSIAKIYNPDLKLYEGY